MIQQGLGRGCSAEEHDRDLLPLCPDCESRLQNWPCFAGRDRNSYSKFVVVESRDTIEMDPISILVTVYITRS